jgi:hypothetical protein
MSLYDLALQTTRQPICGRRFYGENTFSTRLSFQASKGSSSAFRVHAVWVQLVIALYVRWGLPDND